MEAGILFTVRVQVPERCGTKFAAAEEVAAVEADPEAEEVAAVAQTEEVAWATQGHKLGPSLFHRPSLR